MPQITSALLLALAAASPLVSAQEKFNNDALWPNTTYPRAESANPITVAGSLDHQHSPPSYPSPWGEGLGEWAAAYEKARAFVSQLTLEEKVNLTTGSGWKMGRCVGNAGSIPRLGVQALCLQDSPTGVRMTDYNTVFPAAVNIAATWSWELAHRAGRAMGKEHREKGADMQLGPVAGPLGRAPEGGRNWEGFSPDPYLTGVLFAETIKGIHSVDVMTSAKHLIAYEQQHFRLFDESQRFGWNISDSASSNLDDVTMHELYLWPFADGIRAGATSVMCSYNQVNNSQSCQNSYVLNHLLKRELGFQGFVISDWFGTHSGVSSTMAGLDMTTPGDTEMQDEISGRSYFGANLTIAVLNGTVPQWRLDDAATRITAAWYFVGRDKVNETVNFSSWTKKTYGSEHDAVGQGYTLLNEHRDVRGSNSALVRKLGADSTVLLKNTNGALPLTGIEKLTAVFGEDAGPNPLGPNGCEKRGCNKGTLAMGWGSGAPDYASLVTPDEAIHAVTSKNDGAHESILDNYAIPQIELLAPRASVSIVFVNANSGEGGVEVDNNYGDRNNMTLWRGGDDLVRNVSSLCNNTIVVVHGPGAIILEEIKNNPNVTALLWAGMPGDQTGNAIADILYGHVNPGAKLPFTIGARREDWGTDLLYKPNEETDAPQLNFKEGIFIDYRGFDKRNTTPTYEFGYGMSYTTFQYSNIQVIKHEVHDYTPAQGRTSPAPTLGTISTDLADHMFPDNFSRVPLYLYPWPNSTNLSASSADAHYGSSDFLPPGARDPSPQNIVPAGGAPGGNPALWDIIYTVEANIMNTGSVTGEEVVQLYVSLGGPYDAPLVLRGFDRLWIESGQSVTFRADLRRRDIMNWDTVAQDWFVSEYEKGIWVASSSRQLHLSAVLGYL